MSPAAIAHVEALESAVLKMPQLRVHIQHELHAGLYYRTAYLPRDAVITGAFVRIPTLLIVNGDVMVYVGRDEPLHLVGYNVLKAEAGRKQAFVALAPTEITMVFATKAETVEEAENEFTPEVDRLQSRRP